jgi:ferrochelatase
MKGILLVNLGSPESPKQKDVKNYLDEFLMDERVIDVPYIFRWLLVKGIIVNTRAKKSAAAYQKIWTKEGSPLVVISRKMTDKLQEIMDCPVQLGMRYGSLSIKSGLEKLNEQGVKEVLMIPLYPQFAMSSTETVIEKAKEVIGQFKGMKMDVLPAFYNDESYLTTISNQMKSEIIDDNYDHFLFSYHGLPERHIKKSDVTQSHCKIDASCCQTPSEAHEFCYRHQAYKSTEEIVKRLDIKEGYYTTSFQSRLGRDPWLQPYTDETLVKLAESGKKNIKVVSPSFVADCLETLEEMDMENREIFLKSGGEKLQLISCLNENENWIEVLQKWSLEWIQEKNEKKYLKIK